MTDASSCGDVHYLCFYSGIVFIPVYVYCVYFEVCINHFLINGGGSVGTSVAHIIYMMHLYVENLVYFNLLIVFVSSVKRFLTVNFQHSRKRQAFLLNQPPIARINVEGNTVFQCTT